MYSYLAAEIRFAIVTVDAQSPLAGARRTAKLVAVCMSDSRSPAALPDVPVDFTARPRNPSAMNCPACDALLETLKVDGLAVDVCRIGCGGVWFDNFELRRVDAQDEKLGAALAALAFNPGAIELHKKRPCPKCAGLTMLQHKFSREKPVLVDECPGCGGIWLDGGELAQLRQPVATKDDRQQLAQNFFNHLLAQELAELRARRDS